MHSYIGSFFWEYKNLFFIRKSRALYMFMYPVTSPRLWPTHLAFLWLPGDSQHAWLPTVNYFPNILLFIASKYPVSCCVSVAVTVFYWHVNTTERIPLAVLTIERWNHKWLEMAAHFMFLTEVKGEGNALPLQVLTGPYGGWGYKILRQSAHDLRFSEVGVPLSVSHSCVWPHLWAL
jgi:hypothetical protein